MGSPHEDSLPPSPNPSRCRPQPWRHACTSQIRSASAGCWASLSLSAARHGFSSDGRWGLPCQRRRAGRPRWEPRRGQPRHAGLPLRPPIAIRRRGAVVPALLPVRPLLLSNPCFLSLLFSPSIFYPGEVTLSSFRLQAWRTPAACWALPTCRQRTGLGGG